MDDGFLTAPLLSENEGVSVNANADGIESQISRKNVVKQDSKRCGRCSCSCWIVLVIFCILIVAIIILTSAISFPVVYHFGQFKSNVSQTRDILFTAGRNILIPPPTKDCDLQSITENLIHFTLTKTGMPGSAVAIYRIPCNSLSFVPQDSKPTFYAFNFSVCSNKTCFFDVHEAVTADESAEISFNITSDDFVEGATEFDILAFLNDDYTPLVVQRMLTRNIFFAVNVTDIKSAVYYSFAIKLVKGSSRLFTIEHIAGFQLYYNTSGIPVWCSTNNTTTCTDDCNTKYCYIGQLQETKPDRINVSLINEQAVITQQITNNQNSLVGDAIHVFSAAAAVLLVAMLIFLFIGIRKLRMRGRINELISVDGPLHSDLFSSDDTSNPKKHSHIKVHSNSQPIPTSPSQLTENSRHSKSYCDTSVIYSNVSGIQFDTERYRPLNEHPSPSYFNIKEVRFNEKGLKYCLEEYGAVIRIPEGAVEGPATLQIGGSLLFPDFKLEGQSSHTVVSPFIWIHTYPQLKKAAQVYIPHYIVANGVKLFLATRGHGDNDVFKLRNDIEVEVSKKFGCVEKATFCVLCLIAAAKKETLVRKHYVLRAEKTSKCGRLKEIVVVLLYTDKCRKNVTKYYENDGYTVLKPIDELDAEISDEGIIIATDLPPDGDWKFIDHRQTNSKIKEGDIDFFKLLHLTGPQDVTNRNINDLIVDMTDLEADEIYPPRFKFKFENQRNNQPIEVKIFFNNLKSGEFSFTTKLGEDQYSFSSHQIDTDASKDYLIKDLIPYIEGALTDFQTYLDIGKGLKLQMNELLEISHKYDSCFNEQCAMEMLLKWRERSHDASYENICEILHECGYIILSAIVRDHFAAHAIPIDYHEVVMPEIREKENYGYKVIRKELSHTSSGMKILHSEPTDKMIFHTITPHMKARWRKFGVQVGLKNAELDAIRINWPNDCQKCFSVMIETWRKKNSQDCPFTWNSMIRVLYLVRGYKAGEEVYKHLKYDSSQMLHMQNPS